MRTRRSVVAVALASTLGGCLGLEEASDDGSGDPSANTTDAGEATDPSPDEVESLEMTEVWHRETDVERQGAGTLFGDDSIVGIDGDAARLTRFNPADGEPRWTVELEAPIPEHTDCLWKAADGESIVVGDESGTVRVVDADDGAVDWTATVDEPTLQAVVATDDAVVAAWQGSDSDDPAGVDCFERATGTRRWSLDKDDIEAVEGISTVLLSTLSPPYGGVVEVGGWNGGVTVDVDDGTIREDIRSYTTQPVVDDGELYVSTSVGDLDRFDVPDRTKAWSMEPTGRTATRATVHDDSVYFGADDHGLYCLDRTSGEQRWRYQADGEIRTTPCVYDGLVWTVSESDRNRLLAVEADEGTPAGTVTFDDGWIVACGVVGDALYVRTSNGLRRLER